MLEQIKNKFNKQKNKEQIIQEFLDKLTYESLPERIKKEGEDRFYNDFNFMSLYTTKDQAGFEKYVIYGVLIIQIISLFKVWN